MEVGYDYDVPNLEFWKLFSNGSFNLDIGGRSFTDKDVTILNILRERIKMLRFGPRYHDLDASERARYRKELKIRLIALICIYAGFSAWWMIMSEFVV